VLDRAAGCPALAACPTGGACHRCPFRSLPTTRTIQCQPLATEATETAILSDPEPLLDHGAGRPLPAAARADFERQLGHDFADVRLHTDGAADASARAVRARAFTVGRDIAFAAGQYQPETTEGRRLLAHELTHVVQQSTDGSGAAGPRIMRQAEDGPRPPAGPTTGPAVGPAAGPTAGQAAGPAAGPVHYAGCTRAATGVDNPDDMIDSAIRLAITYVNHARADLTPPFAPQTLLSLDRHFHCPSVGQVGTIIRHFERIYTQLLAYASQSGFVLRCAAPGTCPPGMATATLPAAVEFCPGFFAGRTASQQAGDVIVAASVHQGRTHSSCVPGTPCYDDFTIPAESAVVDGSRYAQFAREISGRPPLSVPPTIPCRPTDTGLAVVVPPEAASDPTTIHVVGRGQHTLERTGPPEVRVRPLGPVDPREDIPERERPGGPGPLILTVYQDRAGNRFIYHRELPGGRVYLPGESPRFYLPEGILP
jgi:hypothetical protein